MEKRLYAIRLLSYWALIEIAITMVVLFKKGHHQDFPDNYLHGFCDNNACQMVIVKSLYVKLASAILLFLGCIWVSGVEYIANESRNAHCPFNTGIGNANSPLGRH